jgi:hypothetical protein
MDEVLENKYKRQLAYRERNREQYNELQRKYYKDIKENPERYEKRMITVKNAVKKYQEKINQEKKIRKQEKKKIKEARTQAIKMWKEINNIKRLSKKKINEEWIEKKTIEILSEPIIINNPEMVKCIVEADNDSDSD